MKNFIELSDQTIVNVNDIVELVNGSYAKSALND